MLNEQIQTKAYYNWLKNGPDSDPVQNWLDAEREVNSEIFFLTKEKFKKAVGFIGKLNENNFIFGPHKEDIIKWAKDSETLLLFVIIFCTALLGIYT